MGSLPSSDVKLMIFFLEALLVPPEPALSSVSRGRDANGLTATGLAAYQMGLPSGWTWCWKAIVVNAKGDFEVCRDGCL